MIADNLSVAVEHLRRAHHSATTTLGLLTMPNSTTGLDGAARDVIAGHLNAVTDALADAITHARAAMAEASK